MTARAHPLASTFVDVGDHRLHVWRSTDATSPLPAVVLVHGIVSSRYLLPTAAWLARRRTVAAVELPGFGRSTRPPRPLAIEALADVLAGAIGGLGLSGSVVAGHSVGAQVVLDLAVRHGQCVRGIALVGPTGDPRVSSVPHLLARWCRTARREPLGFHAIVLREIAALGPSRMLGSARRALADPVPAKLGAVALPALVVRGAHDRIAPPRWVEELQRRLPGARLAMLSGVAHTVVFSAPQRLGPLLDDFARLCADRAPERSGHAPGRP